MKRLILMAALAVPCTAPAEGPSDATFHNKQRVMLNSGEMGQVPVPALPLLRYSQGLADMAMSWANECVADHSPDRHDVGENIYIGSTGDVNIAVLSWVAEHEEYDPVTGDCEGECGHFTQVASSRSTHVGCAVNHCPSIEGLETSGNIIVCNYQPHGNIRGKRPYAVGVRHADIYANGVATVEGVSFKERSYDIELYPLDDKFKLGQVSRSTDKYNYFDGEILYVPTVNIEGADTSSWAILERRGDMFSVTESGTNK